MATPQLSSQQPPPAPPPPLNVAATSPTIQAPGLYLFFFPQAVQLPGIAGTVTSVQVRVDAVTGAWVAARYGTPNGPQSLAFNSSQLLAHLRQQ